MKTGKLKAAAIVLLAVVVGVMAFYIFRHLPPITSQPPRAVQGILDLRNWDFEQDGVLSLEGEWEFFWQELLSPEDFKGDDAAERTGYILVPGVWNGYAPQNGNGQKLPGEGYATDRLVVLTNTDDPMLGLKI